MTSTALITGAAQRIGAEIARRLHQQDCNVIIHYRGSADAAKKLAAALNQQRNGSAQCLQADLSNMDDVKRLAKQALACFGQIDVLVNNASSFYPTAFQQASEDDWSALIDSNVKGPFFLSQYLSDSLKKQQGCIINLVDIHSEKPLREHSIYCMAKAAVAMMTQSLAKELAPEVRVNGVSPGAILWPEQEMNNKQKESVLEKVPMQRTGEASDIAKTVAFLVNDAPYITGQIIAVDGGRSLNL
ncbi:MAG: pteridine reductase [Oceanicoccus sp.]|jgi:pteridine reductase